MLLLLLCIISNLQARNGNLACLPPFKCGFLLPLGSQRICVLCVSFQMQLRFRNPLKKKQNVPIAQP